MTTFWRNTRLVNQKINNSAFLDKKTSLYQHNSLGLFPSTRFIPPLLWWGLRRRRQEIVGGLRFNLDDFLSKIDDFEV